MLLTKPLGTSFLVVNLEVEPIIITLDSLSRIHRILQISSQGKTLAEGKGEIGYGAGFVEWFSEEARRMYGDTVESPSPSKRMVVIKQPCGVASMITPVTIIYFIPLDIHIP